MGFAQVPDWYRNAMSALSFKDDQNQQVAPLSPAAFLAGGNAADAVKPATRKSTGGTGRAPTALIEDTKHSIEHRWLVAYRCVHADGPASRRWGCSYRKAQEAVRSGMSRKVFQRAVREARLAGHLEREQGKRRAGRGRGFAVDRLGFATPEKAYVLVDRELFNGTLTPKEILVALALRIRGNRLAQPWQLRKTLGITAPTLNACMETLVEKGLAANYGTAEKPVWGLATVKNPTLKKTPLKSSSLKKTPRTRLSVPSRQSVPHKLVNHHKAVPEKPKEATDEAQPAAPSAFNAAGIIAGAVAGSAMEAGCEGGAPRPRMVMDAPGVETISEDARRNIEAMGEDPDEFLDRALYQKDKGRRIGSLDRYCVESAAREAAKKSGAPRETVMAAATGNKWAKQAAYATVLLGADPDAERRTKQREIGIAANERLRERDRRGGVAHNLTARMRR